MMMVETHPAGAAVVSTVGFPLDRVWGALRVAYDSLALPVSSMDVATRTIATQSLRARRRLGNVALSRYVNCGNTQGGASADSYELMLSVTTQAAAGESGTTRLTTNVEAQGRPITLAAEYARCTSTGVLETRLRELVTAQLNR